MERKHKATQVITRIVVLCFLMLSTNSGWSQGMGLGTTAPTEILHLKRDQNVITGDVAIRYETQAAGTGAITSGPLSGTSSNLAGVGTIAWTNPTNADATDDTYATSTFGTSNYLYSDIGFTIPGGATINSIDIEVEKSYTNNPVTQLDAWAGNSHSINNTSYSYNYTVSAGTDRVLVVCVFQNNNDGAARTLSTVTYGGRNLTNRGVIQNSNNDDHTLEIWTLSEADIALAGSTSLLFTWSGQVRDAQFYYAGSYEYVDQTNPISAAAINTANNVGSLQLSTPLTVNNGDMVISTAGFGNDNRTLTAPTGYGVQVTQEVNSGPDGSFNVSTKAITASGSEQPTTAYAGGVEDMSVGAIVINNGFGNTTDNVVSLYSGGALIGANLASGTAWTTTDAYTSYAGVATEAQINVADFGLVVSATVTGTFCTAQIDHVRISVTYTTTPAVTTDYATGLDLSTGNYVISQSSTLGTSDVMRMNTGSITFSVAAGVFSDYRFKTNVLPLSGTLNKLNRINGVSYDMRIDEFPGMSFSKERQIGFIAQDLEKVYPELIRTDDQGFKSVMYATMTPILVEAIKELNKKVEQLEKENLKLSAELNRYEYLEKEMLEMKKILEIINAGLNRDITAKK
jgi:Chaperone of endosialidase